jgi:Protein of unknown function (DUF1573)
MKLDRSAIILLLSFVVSFSTGWGAGIKGPSLTVERVDWDFGSVPSDFRLIHYYKIKNTGNDILHVTRLNANCDCTSAQIKDSLVAPGDSTNIRMVFNTREYYGTTNRKLTIISNDPSKPAFDVDYSANIDFFHKLHTSDPKYLTFLQGQNMKPVKLINNSGDEIDYILEKEPDSIFTVDKTSGSIGAGKYETVNVTIKDNLRKGTFYSNFTVTYNTEPKLRLSIPVKVVRY